MEVLEQQQYLMKKIAKYHKKIRLLMGILDIVSQIVEDDEIQCDSEESTITDSDSDDDTLKTSDIALLSDDE